MKLYYFESINPRKACAAARYLGSPVEFVRIDLGKGEHKAPGYLAINPNGKVPALTDGETKIWESNSIMAYLARAAGSDLWPRDDDRKLDVMRWLSWNSEHFTRHAGTLYFQHIIKPNLLGGTPDPKAVEEATGFFKQFAGVLNDHLSGRKFLIGDSPTIADFAVAVTLPYAEKAKIPVAEFPAVAGWHDRMNELPGWREPFPVAKTAVAA